LKVANWGINANDSQLVQAMKMTDQHVALAYRVPPQILGVGNAGPSNTTEELMNNWLAGALGFCLNHVEEAIGNVFGLAGQPDEYLELDTKVLMRSAFKDMVQGFAQGVLGGIYAPDEARAEFSLSKVKGGFGEEPRVQSQVVPLSAAAAIPTSPAAPAQPAAPPPASKEFTDGDRARLRSRFRLSYGRQQLRISRPAG
jgi:phage portal protein BeeE